jgi:hypothetical protein
MRNGLLPVEEERVESPPQAGDVTAMRASQLQNILGKNGSQ